MSSSLNVIAGERPGCYLKIEFGTTEIAEMPASQADASKKSGWLPVLVVLFLISYALMTMLIIEQGRTIDSQRALIHELYSDSTELSALRLKAQQEQAQAQSPSAVEPDPSSQIATQTLSSQTPSTQIPLTQNPLTQTPLAQAPAKATPSPRTPSAKTPSTQIPLPKTPSTQANQPRHAQSEAAKQKPFRMPSKPASDLVDADRELNLI